MIDELLDDESVVSAAAAVRGAGHDPVDSIARAAWSVLAEPGDGVAGALIAEFGAAEALRVGVGDGSRLVAPPSSTSDRAARALADARRRWKPRAAAGSVLDALRSAAEVGAALLIPGDPDWPRALDDLHINAPAALWVRGDVRLIGDRAHLAVVGARAATAYGDLLAAEIAGDLADTGTVIVSGGAYGIDGARIALRSASADPPWPFWRAAWTAPILRGMPIFSAGSSTTGRSPVSCRVGLRRRNGDFWRATD